MRNNILYFQFEHHVTPEEVDDIKNDMIDWAMTNNFRARCLGTFLNQDTWQLELRWFVPIDKEKTMFNIKWR